MGVKLGDAFVEITGDDKPLNRAFDRAKSQTQAFGGVLQGILQGVGQRLFDGIIHGARMMISEIGDAIQASSNLSESINKVGVVFGDSADEIMEWSKTSSTAFGQSQQTALEAAGTFGNLFDALGLTADQTKEMSIGLVELASDLASFNNITPDEALIKLRAGIVGETEPLRTLGVNLNATVVAAKAMTMGLGETEKELSDQDKVLARYAIILEQSANAQGDFARTSTGLANAQRILAAQMENGAASIGDSFRPAMEAITNLMVGIAPQMFGYAQNIMQQFANGLADGIRAIIPIITVIRQLFTYWFAPGSPPRVLPDIARWGAAAMGQFLLGFSSVDVKKAFDSVGSAIENVLRSNVAAGKTDEGGLINSVLGTRDAIAKAVAEFAKVGSVSAATIEGITRAAGTSGPAISALVTAYFNLQKATTAATKAQNDLNNITERYDRILNPLRGQLDAVRNEQQRLANQQRLIAAQNTLNNVDSTAAEKRAAQLEIEQISLEEQIATYEQRQETETDAAQQALDNAKEQESAAQSQLDIAQATIDQQVQVNNLLAEQKRYVEQLAAAQEAAAKKAQAEAEAAASKAEQAAEQARREAEQLTEAQLRYRLEVADTAGDIAIMEEELSKLTPGSLEYINIQTQLVGLHRQYNAELEAAAKKASALAGVNAGPGIEAGITSPLGDATTTANNLSTAINEMADVFTSDNFKTIPQNVKQLADRFSALFDAIEKVGIKLGIFKEEEPAVFFDGFGKSAENAIGPVDQVNEGLNKFVDELGFAVDLTTALINGDWATAWSLYKEKAVEAHGGLDAAMVEQFHRLESLFSFFQYATTLSWSKYWDDWKKIFSLGSSAILTAVGEWFNKQTAAWNKWFDDTLRSVTGFFGSIGSMFSKAGKAATDGFFSGLKSGWTTTDTWFKDKLASMRNLLPFSEPKDPSSPLRGLSKSGESMIGMIQAGMEKASTDFGSTVSNLRPQALATAAATTTSTNNWGGINVTVQVTGTGKTEDVRTAATTGVMDALRAAGATL